MLGPGRSGLPEVPVYIETRTLLPVYRWAEIMGIDPLHFMQVLAPAKPPTVCEMPWLQYEWQAADRVGREAVARAIAEAERNMKRVLGFSLLPSYEVNERKQTIQPFFPGGINYAGTDLGGRRAAIELDFGQLRTFGQRAKALISNANIVWSDENSDGYFETGTATAATVVSDVNEIAVYMPGKSGDDRYEIRPLMSVDISGGNVTVTFRRELAVDTDIYTAVTDQLVTADGTDDGDFASTVDIYRVYTDHETQVQFLWEPFSDCGCDTGTCSSCLFTAQYGCLMMRNKVAGLVSYAPGDYDSDTGTWSAAAWSVARLPDQLRVWYRAGWVDESLPRPEVQMAPEWEQAVAFYAAALLDRSVCECNNVHAWIEKWRQDRAATQPEGTVYSLGEGDRDNPFGPQAGAIYAWKRVNREGTRLGYAARV